DSASAPRHCDPISFSFLRYADHRYLHSFPTRRSSDLQEAFGLLRTAGAIVHRVGQDDVRPRTEARQRVDEREAVEAGVRIDVARSEEHTSELQSRGHLVCRLLLEKKK